MNIKYFRCSFLSEANNGWTPLMYAVVYKQIYCIEFLLNIGADTTIKNKSGQYAIDIAKSYQRAKIITMLEEDRFSMISLCVAKNLKVINYC